jgi:hypothetical protein
MFLLKNTKKNWTTSNNIFKYKNGELKNERIGQNHGNCIMHYCQSHYVEERIQIAAFSTLTTN